MASPQQVRPPLPARGRRITVTLDARDLVAARRELYRAGQHQAAVRVLQAYAEARTATVHQTATPGEDTP